ncbi:MAG: VacB/RNase II family 3'-5' exoribonuclease [Kiritimatiellae bacterium]|nr:VacB/RNase II family 3'-5' exoribonuclease [Kiritimatiellia bacterium]
MNKRKEKLKNKKAFHKTQVVEGRLHIVRNGSGLITDPSTGETIWIEPKNLLTSMPGDLVRVKILPPPRFNYQFDTKTGISGRVIEVLERAERVVVGTVVSIGRFVRVKPLNPMYRQDFIVHSANGAKLKDRVTMRMVSWRNERLAPEGEVIDVLGPADDPSIDTLAVMKQFDLPEFFPPQVLEEAERVGELKDGVKRLDLRRKFVFTCDPESARDYDDAISLYKDKKGRRVLGVHIADVSHYIRQNSAIDREAYKRSTSVYLIDKVIPMLPEQLSNGVCSLVPNEDRLTFSVFLTFDEKGNCVERKFAKTIIRSKVRYTYEQVMEIIKNGPGKDRKRQVVNEVSKLAQQMKKIRFSDGALDMDVPEAAVKLDEKGMMTGIELRPYDESHQMIEECMVAANEAVAMELWTKGIKIPARLHEPPDPVKLDELRMAFENIGVKCGDLSQQKALGKFLKKFKKLPLSGMLTVMVLRSMKRAMYSAEAIGHYGLAKKFYAHFTSPIRRYPDLVLHRQLSNYLVGGKAKARIDQSWLVRQTSNASDCEQNADDAERMLTEIKKFRYLQQILKTGNESLNVFKGVIGKCAPYGAFVDLPDLALGGMIHISALSKEYVYFDAAMQSLRDNHREWNVGDEITVRITNIDFDGRKIDFEPVERFSRRKKKRR